MLNSRQKKAYLILTVFAVGWRLIGSKLWYEAGYALLGFVEDLVWGQEIFLMLLLNLFPRYIGLFGFYVLAVGSACIAIRSEEKQKRFLYLLSLALVALWIAVPFFDYLTIKDMSFWHPNMSHSNFIPFHGSFLYFINCMLFSIATDGDSWLNIQLFIPLGILAAGCRNKWLCAGIVLGAGLLIEIMQFCTSIGHFDANDMVYRIIGILIGLSAGIFILKKRKKCEKTK